MKNPIRKPKTKPRYRVDRVGVNACGGKKHRGGCNAFEWSGKPDIAETVKF